MMARRSRKAEAKTEFVATVSALATCEQSLEAYAARVYAETDEGR